MRRSLNVFTPVLPAMTHIAISSGSLLPALRERADVTVWWDQPRPGVRVFDPRQPAWRELNAADLNVYHIGNNAPFHGGIWRVAQRCPGLVILHDTKLHDLVAGMHAHEPEAYYAALEDAYGPFARYVGEAFRRGKFSPAYMAGHFPFTEFAVRHALGVLVHTRGTFRALASLGRQPVLYAPLHYRPGLPTRVPKYDGRVHVVTIAHAGANRRMEQLIDALGTYRQRDRLRVEVFGQLHDAGKLQGRLIAAGLEDVVHLRGFAPEEELNAGLAAADLALNLRFPTMGEASSCQLTMWEHSLPTIVLRTGWFAEQPADTMAFVEPGDETAGLAHHFDAFLADRRPYEALGRNGRRLLESAHTVEKYADALMELVEAAIAFRPKAAAFRAVERAVTCLRPGAETRDAFQKRIAQQVHGLFVA